MATRKPLEKGMAIHLPGEFHGQRSLVSYSPRGHKEWDTTERLTLSTLSLENLKLLMWL